MEQLTATKMDSNFESIRDVDAVTLDAKTLSSDFSIYQNSKFQSVRIYGTPLEPLFIVKDIEKTLRIKDLQIRHNNNYVVGKHYVKIRIDTKGGRQEAIALTEQGLYEAVYSSRSEIAREFKDFIYVVLHRLRISGRVTIEEAKEDHVEYRQEYERHIQDLKARLEGRDHQLDELHRLDITARRVNRDWDRMESYRYEILQLENELDAGRDKNVEMLESKIDELLQECGNTVYMYTVRPPKLFRIMFAEDTYDWENDEVPDDENTFFGLFDHEPQKGTPLGEIYLKKPNKALWLKNILRKERCTVVPKAGEDLGKRLPLAESMPNCFYGSFQFVQMYARDLFLDVRTNPSEIPTDTASDTDPLI